MAAQAKSRHPNVQPEWRTIATFMPKTDEKGKTLPSSEQEKSKVEVHFNPESLDMSFAGAVKKGKKDRPAQVSATETTATLSMELIFDTTLTGYDVRTETIRLVRMMDPTQKTPWKKKVDNKKLPSIVIFQWETIWFEGYIDSYREKIDFFSAEGVPLRATVTISMTQQQSDLDPSEQAPVKVDLSADGGFAPQNKVHVDPVGKNTSITDVAKKYGNPAAARLVAALNGIESIRLPEVGELVIMESGLAPSPRFDGTMNQAVEDIGRRADGETAAMFSNLRTSMGPDGDSLAVEAGISIDMESRFKGGRGARATASFGLGGQGELDSNAGLTADVGVFADIELGIQFEE